MTLTYDNHCIGIHTFRHIHTYIHVIHTLIHTPIHTYKFTQTDMLFQLIKYNYFTKGTEGVKDPS